MKVSIWNLMLVLGLVAGASIAHADGVQAVRAHNQFSFVINSEDGFGNYTYYNGQSVQERTQDVLEKLGATSVQVYVANDIDDLILDPVVEVQFDSIHLATAGAVSPFLASWKEVTFQGSDDGDLVSGILDGVKSRFEIQSFNNSFPNVGTSQPYHFDLTTLFAQ